MKRQELIDAYMAGAMPKDQDRDEILRWAEVYADAEMINSEESESQTIKPVNPSAYWFNAELIGFEKMKGRTVSELDVIEPLYTMQLTDK